jgi:hypothetical protein
MRLQRNDEEVLRLCQSTFFLNSGFPFFTEHMTMSPTVAEGSLFKRPCSTSDQHSFTYLIFRHTKPHLDSLNGQNEQVLGSGVVSAIHHSRHLMERIVKKCDLCHP